MGPNTMTLFMALARQALATYQPPPLHACRLTPCPRHNQAPRPHLRLTASHGHRLGHLDGVLWYPMAKIVQMKRVVSGVPPEAERKTLDRCTLISDQARNGKSHPPSSVQSVESLLPRSAPVRQVHHELMQVFLPEDVLPQLWRLHRDPWTSVLLAQRNRLNRLRQWLLGCGDLWTMDQLYPLGQRRTSFGWRILDSWPATRTRHTHGQA